MLHTIIMIILAIYIGPYVIAALGASIMGIFSISLYIILSPAIFVQYLYRKIIS